MGTSDDLVLGLLDNANRIGDPGVASRARSLTIDWSRFKYSGPIIEDPDLGEILARGHARGFHRCLVQSPGHVLREIWTPGATPNDALTMLERWSRDLRFVAAGEVDGEGAPSGRCLLVDLVGWHEAGRPRLDRPGVKPLALPVALSSATADLHPEQPASAAALAGLLGSGIERFDARVTSPFSPAARDFLETIRILTGRLPQGVFVWNIEGYADVERPPQGLTPPLSALYSVAAGLKPNRILETHGFDRATEVVYFDYSRPALRFRELLRERWDGRDYPAFLRRLFSEWLPPDQAFYCLWGGQSPEELDWQEVEERWRSEIHLWGGESQLAGHWARYRKLPHRHVHCNLLRAPRQLFEVIRDQPGAAIWWSNAFFSFVSNWFHTARERRAIYRDWLESLAAAAPGLWLYGASSDNVAVNAVQAARYLDWFRHCGGDELEPGRLHRRQIRF